MAKSWSIPIDKKPSTSETKDSGISNRLDREAERVKSGNFKGSAVANQLAWEAESVKSSNYKGSVVATQLAWKTNGSENPEEKQQTGDNGNLKNLRG
jgi:hypothetical protein